MLHPEGPYEIRGRVGLPLPPVRVTLFDYWYNPTTTNRGRGGREEVTMRCHPRTNRTSDLTLHGITTLQIGSNSSMLIFKSVIPVGKAGACDIVFSSSVFIPAHVSRGADSIAVTLSAGEAYRIVATPLADLGHPESDANGYIVPGASPVGAITELSVVVQDFWGNPRQDVGLCNRLSRADCYMWTHEECQGNVTVVPEWYNKRGKLPDSEELSRHVSCLSTGRGTMLDVSVPWNDSFADSGPVRLRLSMQLQRDSGKRGPPIRVKGDLELQVAKRGESRCTNVSSLRETHLHDSASALLDRTAYAEIGKAFFDLSLPLEPFVRFNISVSSQNPEWHYRLPQRYRSWVLMRDRFYIEIDPVLFQYFCFGFNYARVKDINVQLRDPLCRSTKDREFVYLVAVMFFDLGDASAHYRLSNGALGDLWSPFSDLGLLHFGNYTEVARVPRQDKIAVCVGDRILTPDSTGYQIECCDRNTGLCESREHGRTAGTVLLVFTIVVCTTAAGLHVWWIWRCIGDAYRDAPSFWETENLHGRKLKIAVVHIISPIFPVFQVVVNTEYVTVHPLTALWSAECGVIGVWTAVCVLRCLPISCCSGLSGKPYMKWLYDVNVVILGFLTLWLLWSAFCWSFAAIFLETRRTIVPFVSFFALLLYAIVKPGVLNQINATTKRVKLYNAQDDDVLLDLIINTFFLAAFLTVTIVVLNSFDYVTDTQIIFSVIIIVGITFFMNWSVGSRAIATLQTWAGDLVQKFRSVVLGESADDAQSASGKGSDVESSASPAAGSGSPHRPVAAAFAALRAAFTRGDAGSDQDDGADENHSDAAGSDSGSRQSRLLSEYRLQMPTEGLREHALGAVARLQQPQQQQGEEGSQRTRGQKFMGLARAAAHFLRRDDPPSPTAGTPRHSGREPDEEGLPARPGSGSGVHDPLLAHPTNSGGGSAGGGSSGELRRPEVPGAQPQPLPCAGDLAASVPVQSTPDIEQVPSTGSAGPARALSQTEKGGDDSHSEAETPLPTSVRRRPSLVGQFVQQVAEGVTRRTTGLHGRQRAASMTCRRTASTHQGTPGRRASGAADGSVSPSKRGSTQMKSIRDGIVNFAAGATANLITKAITPQGSPAESPQLSPHPSVLQRRRSSKAGNTPTPDALRRSASAGDFASPSRSAGQRRRSSDGGRKQDAADLPLFPLLPAAAPGAHASPITPATEPGDTQGSAHPAHPSMPFRSAGSSHGLSPAHTDVTLEQTAPHSVGVHPLEAPGGNPLEVPGRVVMQWSVPPGPRPKRRKRRQQQQQQQQRPRGDPPPVPWPLQLEPAPDTTLGRVSADVRAAIRDPFSGTHGTVHRDAFEHTARHIMDHVPELESTRGSGAHSQGAMSRQHSDLSHARSSPEAVPQRTGFATEESTHADTTALGASTSQRPTVSQTLTEFKQQLAGGLLDALRPESPSGGKGRPHQGARRQQCVPQLPALHPNAPPPKDGWVVGGTWRDGKWWPEPERRPTGRSGLLSAMISGIGELGGLER
eukprot:TRINITY_DN4754_c3_g1_i1.p1 TRINITY_DN4754_c3_g1~~TRINITY_DN4754_c3_g1_i1.p1  ORF type:complete len:1712 (+),score=321.91 TRINITY_DN4754_c3_g1_i1:612-5138(+)